MTAGYVVRVSDPDGIRETVYVGPYVTAGGAADVADRIESDWPGVDAYVETVYPGGRDGLNVALAAHLAGGQ